MIVIELNPTDAVERQLMLALGCDSMVVSNYRNTLQSMIRNARRNLQNGNATDLDGWDAVHYVYHPLDSKKKLFWFVDDGMSREESQVQTFDRKSPIEHFITAVKQAIPKTQLSHFRNGAVKSITFC